MVSECNAVARAWVASIALSLLIAACAGERKEDPATSAGGAATADRPDPAYIAELAERFPRLGPEPLPGPRPSAQADPSKVPNLPAAVLETVTGEATFYAQKFEGRRTASGIPFRQNQMVAAHRAYPFGTVLRVTNLRNERSVTVRVVDRGPHGAVAQARNTVLDLSRRAAEALGYVQQGRTPVRVEVLEWGEGISV